MCIADLDFSSLTYQIQISALDALAKKQLNTLYMNVHTHLKCGTDLI